MAYLFSSWKFIPLNTLITFLKTKTKIFHPVHKHGNRNYTNIFKMLLRKYFPELTLIKHFNSRVRVKNQAPSHPEGSARVVSSDPIHTPASSKVISQKLEEPFNSKDFKTLF